LRVRSITLDRFLNENDVPFGSVRLLKADVEGAELAVLEGATQLLTNGSPAIILEALTKDEGRKLAQLLQGFGYRPVTELDKRNLVFAPINRIKAR
jgi:hypothetical protein